MSTIHQIYCTHCTHGSSALERREGDLAARMLGYSARAGSLPAHDLRRYYRQIERYVYYYLPRDTPAEEKLRLTAATAPRRMIYFPSTGGLQVVAQICYRPIDTEGRPGSYFAHALFREEGDGSVPWSQLDCLRLWNAAGWVEEDAAEIPFLLPTLLSLDEMLQGAQPAIDDGVLLSFLNAPAGGPFDDPGGVIPLRWREKDAGERRELFGDAFGGLLELVRGGERCRDTLLAVIESSVAALWFYGMLRLLPQGAISGPISFSTFEPNADRLGTTLAAVEFCDPARTDLKGESYRGRGYVINTFTGRRSESRRQAAGPGRGGLDVSYADAMLRRLAEDGFEGVDWRLRTLQMLALRRAEDLDQLAVVDRLAEVLLQAGRAVPVEAWPTSAAAKTYLRQVLTRELSQSPDVAARLRSLVGSPVHLLLLELLAGGDPTPGGQAGVDFLLGSLPGDRIAALLRSETVSPQSKADVLARFVAARAQLPPGCDPLWDDPGGLLAHVAARLDPAALDRFYAAAAEHHRPALVVAVCQACRQRQDGWRPLSRLVAAMDDEAVLSLHRSLGTPFFKQYPQDEPQMPRKLHAILHSLAENTGQFPERLDVVLAGDGLLPLDRDRSVAAAWAICRRAILAIGQLEGQKHGLLGGRPLDAIEEAVRQMTEAVAAALPAGAFDDDPSGSRRQQCLRAIGRRLLGGAALLSPVNWQNRALWQKVTWYFERGAWPRAPLRMLRPKSARRQMLWIVAGSAGFLAVLIAALALLDHGPSSERTPPKPPESRPRVEQPSAVREQAPKEAGEPANGVAPSIPNR